MKLALTFDDVLIVPRYSEVESRSDCTLQTTVDGLRLSSPIVPANMDTISGFKMAMFMAGLGGLHLFPRYSSVADLSQILSYWEETYTKETPIGVSVGITDCAEVAALCDSYRNSCKCVICFDVAHADSLLAKQSIQKIRESFTGCVIAGNVCTPEGAEMLWSSGADIIKIGIGPGSACTTRIVTGCGYPQLSAIMDIHAALPSLPLIADGGIRSSADACKALAAGATLVMVGGLLAGTDMTPSWVGEGKSVEFRGMASSEAKQAHGLEERYVEGIKTTTTSRPVNSTEATVHQLQDGIRSAMSYVGAKNLQEFRIKAKMVQITDAGRIEGSPHILR